MGRDRVLLEIPSDPLQPIAADFRAFVESAFAHPWPSTTAVREYLTIDVMTTRLRGERRGTEPPAWYVQLTFSACAGMADTSAEVATHWAEIWYRAAEADIVSKYFRPFGFTPERLEPEAPAKLFVPLGRRGYAMFDPPGVAEPEESEDRHFEVDASMLEGFGDDDLTAEWQEVEEALRDVRVAGKCLCQFCAPDLNVARFEQLSIVTR